MRKIKGIRNLLYVIIAAEIIGNEPQQIRIGISEKYDKEEIIKFIKKNINSSENGKKQILEQKEYINLI